MRRRYNFRCMLTSFSSLSGVTSWYQLFEDENQLNNLNDAGNRKYRFNSWIRASISFIYFNSFTDGHFLYSRLNVRTLTSDQAVYNKHELSFLVLSCEELLLPSVSLNIVSALILFLTQCYQRPQRINVPLRGSLSVSVSLCGSHADEYANMPVAELNWAMFGWLWP